MVGQRPSRYKYIYWEALRDGCLRFLMAIQKETTLIYVAEHFDQCPTHSDDSRRAKERKPSARA